MKAISGSGKTLCALAADESWMEKNKRHYQYYPFMNIGHYRLYELVDRDLKKLLQILSRRHRSVCAAGGKILTAGVPFIWCSNNLMVALVTQCLLYERNDRGHSVRGVCRQTAGLVARR